MKIYGLQKTTLLDFPEHIASTIFTAGCNLKCPFCHNSTLIYEENRPEPIDETVFFSFLEKRKGILDGVCITGGEPLICDEIETFISKIKDKGFLVKLDTNGTFPKKLKNLVKNGLIDYVAMDIKSSLENYGRAVGIKNFVTKPIEESVDFLMNKSVDFEFRTTAVKFLHEESDFISISNWLAGDEKYFLQQFINSENVLANKNNSILGLTSFSAEEMESIGCEMRKKIKNIKIRGL